MSTVEQPEDQLTICTKQCQARCCRYITVSVDPPRGESDWDEFRWWLAHAGIMVTKDEDGWMLHVQTRCRHLQADDACGIYEHRMIACEQYDAATCEFTDEVPYDVCLESEADLADHLEARGLKRGVAVAKGVRSAAQTRREPPSGDV